MQTSGDAARPAIATPTPTPASRGWLNASATTIDVGGSTTVTASWEPPGLSTWLGFASDSTAVLGRSSQCSGTRFVEPPSEATLTVYGCQGGSGTVELRAGSITGRLLDSITITVRAPTPTPTPVTPSGELSATKTSIVVGDEVTVSAVNVSPSGQSVYIVTNGRLGFAGPGTCHFEINPRSSGKSARSWTLEGCSPPGSGSVTLKTTHNGQTLVLDSITIDVSPAPTPTNTPTTGPTATTTPVVVPTATTTDPVDPCRSQSDSRAKCTIPPTSTPTPTPGPGPTLRPPTWGITEQAYRWIKLDWTAPDFVDFKLEWGDNYETNWQTTHITVNGNSALFRGFPSKDSNGLDRRGNIQFQLTATAVDGREATLYQSVPHFFPRAIGHQHDHTVAYTLSALPMFGLGSAVRTTAIIAAIAWDNEAYVNACLSSSCSENADHHVVFVDLGGKMTCDQADGPRVGCVSPGRAFGDIETALGTLTIFISDTPFEGAQEYRWTRVESLAGKRIAYGSPIRWRYLESVLLHEFGHAFGLRDGTGGLMSGGHSITASDRARLKEIYERHRDVPEW